MHIPVIHFANLTDLLAEFSGDGRQTVRTATIQRSENKGGQFPHTLITISVDVRALHRGAILSYLAMQEEVRYDLVSNRAVTDQKYKQVWDDAVKTLVAICATIHDAGHDARPGIIDLGDVQPVLGQQWPLSEANHA